MVTRIIIIIITTSTKYLNRDRMEEEQSRRDVMEGRRIKVKDL